MLLVFGAFSWWPIVRAVVMSVQETNLVDAADVGRPRQLPHRARRPAAAGRRSRTPSGSPLLALVFGYPIPLVAAVLMSEVRRPRPLRALAYLPVVVPPVVAVLLWKFSTTPARDGVFNTILGWVGLGPVPVAAVADHGDAVARAGGDLGGGRRHRDHLPRRADQRAGRAVRRGGGRRRRRSGARSGTSPCRSCAASCSITLILQIIGTVQVFLEPYLFTDGGPANATLTVLLLIYKYAFGNALGGDYGSATALSLMLAAFLAVLSLGLLPGAPASWSAE